LLRRVSGIRPAWESVVCSGEVEFFEVSQAKAAEPNRKTIKKPRALLLFIKVNNIKNSGTNQGYS